MKRKKKPWSVTDAEPAPVAKTRITSNEMGPIKKKKKTTAKSVATLFNLQVKVHILDPFSVVKVWGVNVPQERIAALDTWTPAYVWLILSPLMLVRPFYSEILHLLSLYNEYAQEIHKIQWRHPAKSCVRRGWFSIVAPGLPLHSRWPCAGTRQWG